MAGELVLEPRQLRGRRQLAVDQQVADLGEGGLLGELLDRVAAVAQDALLAVDEGDRARAGAGVAVAGVEGDGTRSAAQRGDVDADLVLGADEDRELVLLALEVKLGLFHLQSPLKWRRALARGGARPAVGWAGGGSGVRSTERQLSFGAGRGLRLYPAGWGIARRAGGDRVDSRLDSAGASDRQSRRGGGPAGAGLAASARAIGCRRTRPPLLDDPRPGSRLGARRRSGRSRPRRGGGGRRRRHPLRGDPGTSRRRTRGARHPAARHRQRRGADARGAARPRPRRPGGPRRPPPAGRPAARRRPGGVQRHRHRTARVDQRQLHLDQVGAGHRRLSRGRHRHAVRLPLPGDRADRTATSTTGVR